MKLLIALLSMLFFTSLYAQDCEELLPFKEGTYWEITSFNKRDKETGVMKQTCKEVKTSGVNRTVVIEQTILDKKEKELMTNEFDMQCASGVVFVSMEQMMNQESMEMFAESEVKLEADEVNYPDQMQVGDELKDGRLKIEMVGVPTIMSMELLIINRKVEGKETIETPAGSFECYKISYDTEMHTVLKVTRKTVEWYCPGVGMVRQETYNKKGKLQDYSLLTGFSL